MQNSIAAKASRVIVKVDADEDRDRLAIRIEDNGKGMTPEFAACVLDPFVTTRTTRRVGLGIPMLAAAAQACGGNLSIHSEVGNGTILETWFELHNIDRAPLGDIESTLITTIVAYPNVSFKYEQVVNGQSFVLDTDEINAQLDGVPINDPLVIGWMKEYIEQGLNGIGRID